MVYLFIVAQHSGRVVWPMAVYLLYGLSRVPDITDETSLCLGMDNSNHKDPTTVTDVDRRYNESMTSGEIMKQRYQEVDVRVVIG